jgi:hypothetical protein
MGAAEVRAMMARTEALVVWYEIMGAKQDRNDQHLIAATFSSSNKAIPDSLPGGEFGQFSSLGLPRYTRSNQQNDSQPLLLRTRDTFIQRWMAQDGFSFFDSTNTANGTKSWCPFSW